jgi:hypothetical protein
MQKMARLGFAISAAGLAFEPAVRLSGRLLGEFEEHGQTGITPRRWGDPSTGGRSMKCLTVIGLASSRL